MAGCRNCENEAKSLILLNIKKRIQSTVITGIFIYYRRATHVMMRRTIPGRNLEADGAVSRPGIRRVVRRKTQSARHRRRRRLPRAPEERHSFSWQPPTVGRNDAFLSRFLDGVTPAPRHPWQRGRSAQKLVEAGSQLQKAVAAGQASASRRTCGAPIGRHLRSRGEQHA